VRRDIVQREAGDIGHAISVPSNPSSSVKLQQSHIEWTRADEISCSAPQTAANAETYRRLRQILMSGGNASGAGGAGTSLPIAAPTLTLSDLLTPTNLAPIFAQPELARSIFPHLPIDIPYPPSEHVLRQVISSAQFRGALAELDRALSTGLLGDLVRGLGLPESAGTGIEAFIKAVSDQARAGQGASGSSGRSGDSMQTD